MKTLFFALASCALIAPISYAAPAQPRLVGHVTPAGAGEKSDVWLGGAYFPGKGWRDDAQSKGSLVAGTRWQLFGLNGVGPSVTNGKMSPPDVPEGYVATLRQSVAGETPMIAISNADKSAQPRLPRAQNLNQEIYQRAVGALLRGQGLNVARARLTQVLRVDLNGDGVDEVLLSASSRDDYGRTPEEKRGDYSVTAIRYVDNGVVKSKILDSNISKKDVAFSAPGYFSIMSCVDIDGLGKMEIVVANGYYEGNGFEVWQFDGHNVKRVMSAGWGV